MRPEIQRIIITCEYVLNSIAEKPLNDEERNAIELYIADLVNALRPVASTVPTTNDTHCKVKA
jgi:hypothetical protein